MKDILQRELELNDAVQKDENVIVLSVASSYPYERESKQRGPYFEVLEISEKAIDFIRLVDNRAPLLLNHDTERQIGVVEKAFIEDGKLKVEVRFSDGGFAQQILNDVKNGIRRNTSIGYVVDEAVWTDGIPPTMTAVRWTPHEVSIVSIPADPTVGYQRSLEVSKEEEKCSEAETEAKEEPITEKCGEQLDETKECGDASEDDEIRSLGQITKNIELAEEFINEKRTLIEFKNELNNIKLNVKEKKMAKFSLRKALLNTVGKITDEEAAYEREVIAENKRKYKITDADIVLSNNEIRAFDGTEALNQTVYQPGLYTPENRPKVTVDNIGLQKVAVNGPSISFSVCTSGINAGFVDINGDVPSATMEFALKTMTPAKQGAFVDISYQSLLQDDPSAEAIVMDDIMKALDQSKDAAFWTGTGANGEPSGIMINNEVNTVTLPATPTLSTALEFEKKIRESYDYSGDLKWIFGSNAYYQWASTPYSATEQNKMLLDADTRKCIGYDAFLAPALPPSAVLLGNWNEVLEADFDGIDIKVVTEDTSLARKQACEVIAHRALNFLVRKPKSITKGV